MKNTLEDLNNHLFAQLERLGDEEIKGDNLTEEIERAKAINQVAAQIISNGKLVIDAIKTKEEYMGYNDKNKKIPFLLRESFSSTEG